MEECQKLKRIVFGISGASGIPLALEMLKLYSSLIGLDIHLIISKGAQTVSLVELNEDINQFEKLAFVKYEAEDLGSAPASGSWQHDGMIICPCSMSTLAAIANGVGTNLIHRAADVTLKERRPLILIPRETPFNRIHIVNMLNVTDAGGIIMPFLPAFYTANHSMENSFRQFAGRILDLLHIPHTFCFRWGENSAST